jgi:hypothetical protein
MSAGDSPQHTRQLASVECAVVGAIISRGWRSSARTDTHLTYMIGIALTTEFAITAGGVR